MTKTSRITMALCLASLVATLSVACSGGFETAVIGFANSNDTLGTGGIAEDVAKSLAESQVAPEVTDDMIVEIFTTLLDHARSGDVEAALIVLKIAEEQREPVEE